MLRAIRLVLILVILLLAAVGLYTLMGGGRSAGGPPGPVATSVVALAPVSRGEIVSQFKVITVERQYNIPVIGSAFKQAPSPERDGALGALARAALGWRERVPGTTEELVYEMVTTVTAGIDLSRLRDEQIDNGTTETTVTLPRPEVFSVVTDFDRSGVRYRSGPKLPFMSHSAQLIADLQKAGMKKHRQEAERDQDFMTRARTQARDALQNLLQSTHPGRRITIVFEGEEEAEAGRPGT